jgi:VanZ family protein
MSSYKNILFYLKLWLPVFFWCYVIYFFSNIPNLKIEQLGIFDLLLRKLAHFTEFCVLSILLLRALLGYNRDKFQINKRILFWNIFLCIVYAITDEYHQYFVPGRITALKDILIDTCGIFCGSYLYIKILLNRSKEQS